LQENISSRAYRSRSAEIEKLQSCVFLESFVYIKFIGVSTHHYDITIAAAITDIRVSGDFYATIYIPAPLFFVFQFYQLLNGIEGDDILIRKNCCGSCE